MDEYGDRDNEHADTDFSPIPTQMCGLTQGQLISSCHPRVLTTRTIDQVALGVSAKHRGAGLGADALPYPVFQSRQGRRNTASGHETHDISE